MRTQPRMPELAYPFAVIGLAAGWLSAGLLASPLVRASLGGHQGSAALVSCVVGAALGAALTRGCGDHDPWRGASAMRIRLVVYVALGGVVAGGAVGGLEVASVFGVVSGAMNGLLSAIAFLPVCALVLDAARRAERARHGSIVAGADRRAVWAILAAALSVMTLGALADWPASRDGLVAPPWIAAGLAGAAALLLAGAWVVDAAALARIARARAAATELRDPGEDAGAEPVPEVDLGLGDEVRARVARGAAAYRSRDRAVALLVGSPEQAAAEIRRALRRGAVGLAIAAGALCAHAWAAGRGGDLAWHTMRCDQNVAQSCLQTGALLQDTQQPADDGRAATYYRRACALGLRRACALLASRR